MHDPYVRMNKQRLQPEDLQGAPFELTMQNIESYIRMQQIYTGAIREITTKLQILDEDMRVRLDHNPIHTIESRLKSAQSIAKKLIKKGLEVTPACAVANLTDIAGVRVICHYLKDVFTVADMLCRQDDLTLLRKRDYIAEPKPNGYRSLHLVLIVPVYLTDHTERVPVEVQLRTIAMDFWASLEHRLTYKSIQEIPEELTEELKECAEQAAALDKRMQAIRERMDTLPAEEKNASAPFPPFPL